MSHEANDKFSGLKIAFTVVLSLIILATDFSNPLGLALGMLYIIPVMSTYLLKWSNAPLITGAVLSAFVLLGLFKPAPEAMDWSVVIVNRTLSVSLVLAAAIFTWKIKQLKNRIEKQKDEYEWLSTDYKQQLDTLNQAAIVSIANVDGKIIFVNDLFCGISKYSREELVGANHRILKSGVHSDNLFTGMWKAISSGKTWQGEICNRAKDGSFYWVYTTIVPFTNNKGVIDKFVSVRFDMTQQKNQELQLRKKTRELELANEELEAFSYSVSHDLRAPLRAIEGFAKALKENYENKFDEDANRWLNFVTDNASRMDMLIRDILSFSRISRGEIRLQQINMDLTIRDEFENLKGIYQEKSIIFMQGKGLPEIYGDKTTVKLVFQNLLSNAIKYNKEGKEVKITVDGGGDGQMNWYSIADNGIGFDEKYKDKIFGVFQRLHQQEEYEGTGVGLAIVQRIVNKHGGKIDVKSTEGIGSVFTVYFPVINTTQNNEATFS